MLRLVGISLVAVGRDGHGQRRAVGAAVVVDQQQMAVLELEKIDRGVGIGELACRVPRSRFGRRRAIRCGRCSPRCRARSRRRDGSRQSGRRSIIAPPTAGCCRAGERMRLVSLHFFVLRVESQKQRRAVGPDLFGVEARSRDRPAADSRRQPAAIGRLRTIMPSSSATMNESLQVWASSREILALMREVLQVSPKRQT